ncbi:MAG: hypothetical protein JWP10_890 [Nocardioidaceae bacterium]|nr:hypothetical protein [Nocardioidaceae bacterium]
MLDTQAVELSGLGSELIERGLLRQVTLAMCELREGSVVLLEIEQYELRSGFGFQRGLLDCGAAIRCEMSRDR